MKKILIPAIIGIAVLMAVTSCASNPAPAPVDTIDTVEEVIVDSDAETELGTE
ncbi:hypothetical protein AGMMS49991_11670 [Spirochaetia bacterium]|nr:hypothetical protein AGMMS49991_11670 [Spirochaetia bacterium]